MNSASPVCLVDLLPALRWSKQGDVGVFLRHPRLAEGWWASLPVARAADIVGSTWLAHSVAQLMVNQWDHLTPRELLPGLAGDTPAASDVAEPVSSAISATAGGWDRLLDAPLRSILSWSFPADCDAMAVLGTVVLSTMRRFCRQPDGPLPSPALITEAVRTIANWLPASAPHHVQDALGYLRSATGADIGADTTVPDSRSHPAERAVRTLRALRAQRDHEASSPPAARAADLASDSMHPHHAPSTLIGPDGAMRRPEFGPPRSRRAAPAQDSAPPGPPPAPPADLGEHPLVAAVDQLLRAWEPLERTVAAERLFAGDPVSIRVLAGQVGVDVDRIRSAQRTVEDRIVRWLNSQSGAGLAAHLRTIAERIGSVASVDHVIAAHPEHSVEVPALGAPLWRVVIALFTDRRLHDGWLVNGDPHQMRWHTRQMLGGSPSVEEAAARLSQLGIRTPAVHSWLTSTPGVSIADNRVLLDADGDAPPPQPPPSYPVADPAAELPSSPSTTGGLPLRRRRAEGQGSAPDDPHQAVACSARCFRAPDGRWWHRVDVTADHLNGAPVTVPAGYASHLGIQPGRLLCLTAPGADLLVLVWRDQPAFDSLRPLLRRLSAQPGDRVFINVEGDRLDARRLPAADLSGHGPTAKALHLLGYTAPASTDDALQIIAHRVGEDTEHRPADASGLLDLLERRGDSDIAAELRPALYGAAGVSR